MLFKLWCVGLTCQAQVTYHIILASYHGQQFLDLLITMIELASIKKLGTNQSNYVSSFFMLFINRLRHTFECTWNSTVLRKTCKCRMPVVSYKFLEMYNDRLTLTEEICFQKIS